MIIYATKETVRRFNLPLIDAAATMGDDGSVTVFCVNRDLTEEFELAVDLHAFGRLRLAEHILLHHDDVKAVNTEDSPNTVAPVPGPGGVVDGNEVKMVVKPGDKVVVAKYAGTEVKVEDVEYSIVRQSEILAIVE